MVAECSLARMVWSILTQQFNLPMINRNITSTSLKQWWSEMIGMDSTRNDRKRTQVIYAVWNLWKERCRRVFDSKTQTPAQVASLTKQDLLLYGMAHEDIHVKNRIEGTAKIRTASAMQYFLSFIFFHSFFSMELSKLCN